MARPFAQTFSADFKIGSGFSSFDLIFSSDFTGTVNGVAYDGSTDASQHFDAGNGVVFNSDAIVVVTTGSVRVAGVFP